MPTGHFPGHRHFRNYQIPFSSRAFFRSAGCSCVAEDMFPSKCTRGPAQHPLIYFLSCSSSRFFFQTVLTKLHTRYSARYSRRHVEVFGCRRLWRARSPRNICSRRNGAIRTIPVFFFFLFRERKGKESFRRHR